MDGHDKAAEVANKLRTDAEDKKLKEEKIITEVKQSLELRREQMASIYAGEANVGTEDVGADDVNIPQLKLVQGNKRFLLADNKTKAEEGAYYRTDTREQIQEPIVTLLVFRKVMGQNYKKDGIERQHIYFGLYDGTTEPFRMYTRGWSLSGSRAFLTEAKRFQSKYKIPMFAMKVKMKSIPQSGKTEDGADYSIQQAVFEIVKDETGLPVIETDPERVDVLREFVDRFLAINVDGMDEDSDIKVKKANTVVKPLNTKGEDGDGIPF